VTRLRWIASSEASALHAAAALAEGRKIVDARLAAALAEPAARLVQALENAGLPPADFFRHAIPLACRSRTLDLGQLTVEAANRGSGRESSASDCEAVAGALGELFAAQDMAIPDLAQQLAVRTAPLAEQWEARGPGLLAQIGRSTDRSLIPAEVDVVLVYPACGGGGAASLSYNLVRIEAVLANPCAAIPEVVRLGWLIAQAKFGLPGALREFPQARWQWLAGMALAPAALEAAEYVELTRWDLPTLQATLDLWGLADKSQPKQADALFRWWRLGNEIQDDWEQCVAALDTVLDDPELI
jgi:hypothetical protein